YQNISQPERIGSTTSPRPLDYQNILEHNISMIKKSDIAEMKS
ncbi:hypothetical protein SNEBB_003922, partial [Seison nebaliae]